MDLEQARPTLRTLRGRDCGADTRPLRPRSPCRPFPVAPPVPPPTRANLGLVLQGLRPPRQNTRCHPPTILNRSKPCRIGQVSGPISPPRACAGLCLLVPRCASLCHVVTEPIAHSIAHSHPPTLKTAPRPHRTPLKVVGPAGLEDAAPDCARLCHVVSGCAYVCHVTAVGHAFAPRDRATLCQAVSGCDRGHCTLRCTLGSRAPRDNVLRAATTMATPAPRAC